MKKYLPIYLYGAIIVTEGIFLLFAQSSSFQFVRTMLGLTFAIGSIVAFIATFSRERTQVQFAYHEMHALAMMVYGISILLLCNTIESLISFTAFILLFYGFSEIIFCSWIFNLKQKVAYKILIVRILLGMAIGIGTIIAMHYTNITIEIFGALFIMIGINIMLYVPIIKEKIIFIPPKLKTI